ISMKGISVTLAASFRNKLLSAEAWRFARPTRTLLPASGFTAAPGPALPCRRSHPGCPVLPCPTAPAQPLSLVSEDPYPVAAPAASPLFPIASAQPQPE